MRSPYRAVRVSLLVVMGLALLLWNRYAATAASNIAVTVNLFSQLVDEQNTTAYYNNGTAYCKGSSSPFDAPYFVGDLANGPTTAYNFGPPWTLSSDLSSGQYANGTDCTPVSSCLSVNFEQSNKVLVFDTRQSLGPRKVDLNFNYPCSVCSVPGTTKLPFGTSLSTPALMSTFLNTPFTSMSVCSSPTCPEVQPAVARLWFIDPTNAQVTWRVEWDRLRVLRMSANTWYVLADSCDGTQTATLYREENQRNKVGTSFQGYYLMPFFLTATK